MSQLLQWLQDLGLEQYDELFSRHRIGFDVLPEITDTDLEKMQIPLGDRKRLLRAIGDFTDPRNAASEAAIPEGLERRPVTTLFIDLSDYTRLTREIGAESAHTLASRFHELASEAIRNHGGSVERYIGDAVMAVFGVPIAHGNDPERALRAADAVHSLMPRLSAEVNCPVSVHIGAALGHVVASRRTASKGEFSTVGETVNLAARLVGLASSGQTIISDSLRHALTGHIVAEAIGDVNVKGFDRSVRAWRMLGWSTRLDARSQLPLIGRGAEVRQFEAACAACIEDRMGQVVYVRGDAGIGKSRLVEELETVGTRLSFSVHKARVMNFGVARTDSAVSQLVSSLLGYTPSNDPNGHDAALNRAVTDGLLDPEHLIFVYDLLGVPLPPPFVPLYEAMDNGTRARGRSDTVVTLVRRCSERAPLLLTVEDLHWADTSTLDLIASLSRQAIDSILLLLLTSRLEGDPLTRGWQLRTETTVGMIAMDLRPLRESELTELARALGANSDPLIGQCAARAEGNPLFLEQLLRASQMAEQESVPSSIQSLVLSRLDRLPVVDQRAIRAASVVGQRFSLPLVRQLLGDPTYDCSALVMQDLVRPMGDDFVFAHALIWESTYISLVSEDKRRWHTAAAEWYADRDHVLVAEHLERAADRRAAAAYLTAALEEKRQYHSDRALSLLEHGLELALDERTRFELLVEHGELLTELGRPAEAIGNFESASALAKTDLESCRALIATAGAMRMTDRSEPALAILARAQPLAYSIGRDIEMAQIHYLRGCLYFPLGNIEGCLREHEMALKFARQAQSFELEARALSGLGDAHYAAFRPISSHRYFEECISLSRAHGLGRVEVGNLAMLGIINGFFMMQLDSGLAQSEQALSLASKVGQRRGQVVALHGCTVSHLEMGEPRRAYAFAQASTRLAREIGAQRFVPEGMAFEAICLHQEEENQSAVALLREALQLSREMITYCGPVILGYLALYTDDSDERKCCLKEAEQILELDCAAHNHMFFYRAAMELALRLRDWENVERYASRFEDVFSEEQVPAVTLATSRARALAQAGRGIVDDASLATLERIRDQLLEVRAVAWVAPVDQAIARIRTASNKRSSVNP